MEDTLFSANVKRPLADRLRPKYLTEVVGQNHIIGKDAPLGRMLASGKIGSFILWGPPGCGKTTIARLIAENTNLYFEQISAVFSGVADLKRVFQYAQERRANQGKGTLLFVDEIHRFNKAQQDAFLPYVEKGSIILIGATTENPSFEINSALLSRCKVFVLQALGTADMKKLIERALKDPKGLGNQKIQMEERLINAIAVFANGDARTALNTLDMAVLNGRIEPDGSITVLEELLEQCTGKKMLLYDRAGEEHYNLISALHKSMRNSDPDAAVYWLARMLEAGEDPLYVARRLVRFASEDIGMADPQALQIAVAAYQASHFNGMPECDVNLTHAVVYLSLAPKSNALYVGYGKAREDAKTMLTEPVPLQIRNGVTELMQNLHYGEGYQYAHDTEDKITAMQCLPDSLIGKRYYVPTTQGREAEVSKKMKEIEQKKKELREKRQ